MTALIDSPVLDVKPRMRGWLHAYAFFISIVAAGALIPVSAALRGERAAFATTVYSITVLMLFATSASYHRFTWSPAAKKVMKRLDHSMIFVFIAGSYTPFSLLALPWSTGRVVLAIVWIGAVCGVGLKMAWPTAPRWLAVPLYIALGWVAVAVLQPLLHGAGVAALVLMLAGGLFYTIGAVVYALKKPDPSPEVFGFHEVFHACTIVAAVCHYIAIWLAVFSG